MEDVEKILKAKVKVDIDFLNYHHEYDVRIAFDQNSITPIHVENQMKKRTQLISRSGNGSSRPPDPTTTKF